MKALAIGLLRSQKRSFQGYFMADYRRAVIFAHRRQEICNDDWKPIQIDVIWW
jgi:hypothetical protein